MHFIIEAEGYWGGFDAEDNEAALVEAKRRLTESNATNGVLYRWNPRAPNREPIRVCDVSPP